MSIKDRAVTVPMELFLDEGQMTMKLLSEEAVRLFQEMLGSEPAVWHSCGTSYKRPNGGWGKDFPHGFYYAYGGVMEHEKVEGFERIRYEGAEELYFSITGEYDQSAAKHLAYWGFYSGIRIEALEPDRLLITPGADCKVCSKPLVKSGELQWKTCYDCADACDHEYIEGVGESRGNLAYFPFCKKCGRGDPDWKPSEDPMEDALKVVTEGGLSALLLHQPDGDALLITKE